VARIDPTARVADGAKLADDVEVGPYCIVGPAVELRAGVKLLSHVSVVGATVIGERTMVYPFASLGSRPQSTAYRGGATRLVVGSDCDIREAVTMSVGTEDGLGITEVGDRGFFMAQSHVAHDCKVGNNVIFANGATLGGHCVIGDHVFIGGLSAIHQFSWIGAHAMIGGITGVRTDVIPFAIASGPDGRLYGVNVVGMRRRKFSAEAVRAVRSAYRQLFFSSGGMAERVAAVEKEYGRHEAVAEIIAFVRAKRPRSLSYPDRTQEAQTE
jgi:UDP-N-acetylglucosamine acyltransferase